MNDKWVDIELPRKLIKNVNMPPLSTLLFTSPYTRVHYAWVDRITLLGKSIKVHLKEGGSFQYKVEECGENYLYGYDDEGLNITIDIDDIDFIIGG